MKAYYPDKRALIILQGLLFAVGALLIYILRYFVELYKIRIIVAVIIAVFVLAATFIYLPIYFSSLRYCTGNNEIIKNGGVFLHKSFVIRTETVQYCTLVSTSILRKSGMNLIIFHLYGGRLIIPFVRPEDAMELMKFCSGGRY